MAAVEAAPTARQPLFLHRPPYGNHKEARGWAFDAIGRSTSFVGNAVFVGTAVIHLARINAGCDPQDVGCDSRTTYGIRPSSFLSLYNVIVGLASSALLPLLGSIVDHTHHRRLIARISAVVYCIGLFPLIFLNESTWFMAAVLLVVTAFVGWIHTGMTFAYLPELTEDKKVLEDFNTSFAVVQFVTYVIYVVVVVGITAALQKTDDSIFTAQLAQSISFVVTTLVWGYSWTKLMGHRPATTDLPEGRWLITSGFRNLYRSSVNIWKHHRSLAWFYAALAFSESALQALVVIATTFSIEILNFSSFDSGIAFLIFVFFSAIGCYISPISLKRMNPIRSDQLCISLVGLFTALAVGVMRNVQQRHLYFVFCIFWGLVGGWKYTIERYLVCNIIPKGQDAELMGMYLFAGQSIAWIPPLIFTAMNEAGVSIRLSMLSLISFWIVALSFLQCVGIGEVALMSEVANDTPSDCEEIETAASNEK
ncbi:hypothetical protein ACHAWO_011090 [Cyclotella atomus]|uniref:Uncharacterized protein n=1 Tax=Cyclotella atomus TaxID=382360 RepID=A0ABD3N4J1_9STRA